MVQIFNFSITPILLDMLRGLWFRYLEALMKSGIRLQRELTSGRGSAQSTQKTNKGTHTDSLFTPDEALDDYLRENIRDPNYEPTVPPYLSPVQSKKRRFRVQSESTRTMSLTEEECALMREQKEATIVRRRKAAPRISAAEKAKVFTDKAIQMRNSDTVVSQDTSQKPKEGVEEDFLPESAGIPVQFRPDFVQTLPKTFEYLHRPARDEARSWRENVDSIKSSQRLKFADLGHSGIPPVEMSLSLLILASQMAGETILASDLLEWAETNRFPLYQFAGTYKQFLPYTSNFVVSRAPSVERVYHTAALLSSLLQVKEFLPQVNYPLILRSMILRLQLPDSLLPLTIELGAEMDWSFHQPQLIVPEGRALAIIAFLLKVLYPIIPISSSELQQIAGTPSLSFNVEENTILFYLESLPSFPEWMKDFNCTTGQHLSQIQDSFRLFFNKAFQETGSRHNTASQGTLPTSFLLTCSL